MTNIPNLPDEDIRHKFGMAYRIAEKSNDQSTKNGALLLNDGWTVMTGWNHMVSGYGDEKHHHERPFKYWVTEHAERDVILKAASVGIKTEGLTMLANWVACPDCARAIVEAKLAAVVTHKACMDRTPERWKELVQVGLDIIRSGGVKLIIWDDKVGKVKNLNNGEIWYP